MLIVALFWVLAGWLSPVAAITEDYCHQYGSQNCPAPCVVSASCSLCQDTGCHAVLHEADLKPTPSPAPEGCYYQRVECIQEPCDPILVCPTPTPICSRSLPTLTLIPNSQSGKPGEKLTYNISLTNNDSASCPSISFNLTSQVTSDWTGELSSTSIDLAPNHTYQPQLYVTSSFSDNHPGSKPVSVYAASSLPQHSLQANAAYLLLTAGDLNKNGSVDIFDYNTLIAEFGKTNPLADINGNGKVDIFDYNILVANFGKNGS